MNTDVAQKGASTNNKHTPGPWINKPGFYGSGATADTIKPADPAKTHSSIAHMDKVMWAKPDDPRVHEMRANAALIAAAPALLEACEAAYRWLESAPIAELEAIEDALGANAPLAELEAAIKQVIGERIDHVNL